MYQLTVLELAYLYLVNFLGVVQTVLVYVSPALCSLVDKNFDFNPGTDQVLLLAPRRRNTGQ